MLAMLVAGAQLLALSSGYGQMMLMMLVIWRKLRLVMFIS